MPVRSNCEGFYTFLFELLDSMLSGVGAGVKRFCEILKNDCKKRGEALIRPCEEVPGYA